MVKNFIFIEDGSLDTENLRKILDNSGGTDVKFITYRQGTTKPELVSLEVSEAAQNPEAYKQEAKDELIKALYEFIIDNTERYCYDDHDYMRMEHTIKCKTVYKGTVDDFMENFYKYLNR